MVSHFLMEKEKYLELEKRSPHVRFKNRKFYERNIFLKSRKK